MNREKLKLTREEAKDIVFEDSLDYKVVNDEITTTSRWSSFHDVVIQRVSDNKYFKDSYTKGLTESQHEMPFENKDPNFTEVFPKEKTITIYE